MPSAENPKKLGNAAMWIAYGTGEKQKITKGAKKAAGLKKNAKKK